MENKKLLSYLLKDLVALEEILGGTGNLQLDEIETEFVQTRVKSARKLMQMIIDNTVEQAIATKPDIQKNFKNVEFETPTFINTVPPTPEIPLMQVITETPKHTDTLAPKELIKKEMAVPENPVAQKPASGVIVNEIMEFLEDTITEIAEEEGVTLPNNEEDEWNEEKPVMAEYVAENTMQQELKLDEDSADDQQNKRLGDSFSKEKSVNDLISGEAQKLEQKISNMPLASIQAAIGINDRFQYIRELFDGSADKYIETVTSLDSMEELKDAVTFLQQNFKWKKTEVSLKFVTLIKRRFPQ